MIWTWHRSSVVFSDSTWWLLWPRQHVTAPERKLSLALFTKQISRDWRHQMLAPFSSNAWNLVTLSNRHSQGAQARGGHWGRWALRAATPLKTQIPYCTWGFRAHFTLTGEEFDSKAISAQAEDEIKCSSLSSLRIQVNRSSCHFYSIKHVNWTKNWSQ